MSPVSMKNYKIKPLRKKTNKDPISEEAAGICSKREIDGGIKQGAKGHGFLDGGACPRAACAQIANTLP